MGTVATALLALVVIILTTLARPLINYAVLKYKLRSIDGPRGIPFLGNIFQLGTDGVAFFNVIGQWSKQFRDQGHFVVYFGLKPIIVVNNPDDSEKTLRNTKLDVKAFGYRFLEPWLGDGLLMSTGPKWAQRRKLLTPSFHFTILNKFLDVFNEQAECFAKKLSGLADGRSVDISPLVTLCTLDIICETIMGYNLSSQEGKSKDYVAALKSIGEISQQRSLYPWYWNDTLFNWSSDGKKAARCVKILHDLTKKVIRKRKLETINRAGDDAIIDDHTQEVRKRRRLAFLDLLIEVQKRDASLTDEGIQEEVDTFMFEGHDTTATAIAFSLYLIGRHPHVQEKIQKELDEVFAGQNGRPMTQEDLAKLEYFSCAIKECHRLMTPVPYIGREVEEGFHACGTMIPPGATVFINLFDLHRDPKHFANPEKFDPDRFLPGNSEGRHPFSHLPFSAGHRNCIGQKFALMEQKVVVAKVLRKMRVTSLQKIEDLRLAGEMVLRPVDGLHLKLEMRDKVAMKSH